MRYAFLYIFALIVTFCPVKAKPIANRESIPLMNDTIKYYLNSPLDSFSHIDKNRKEYGKTITNNRQSLLEFYKAIMSDNFNQQQEDSLLKKSATPELIEKYHRQGLANDVNMFLQAQDWTQNGRKSLKCKHLKDDWYEISYQPTPDNEETVYIAVLMKNDNDRPHIAYLRPVRQSEKDSIFMNFNFTPSDIVDNHDAETFITTFYRSYTDTYALMPKSLEDRLSELREKYCTSEFKFSFEKERQIMLSDGISNYDLLLNNTDFDVAWRPSLTISKIKNCVFEIVYKGWFPEYTYSLMVSVGKKNGNNYKIINIEVKE